MASIPSPTRTTRPESSPRCARELVRAANDRTASSDIHPARTRVAPGRARILTTLALLPSVPDPQARHITTAEYKPGARHTLTVYTPVEGEFILTASAGAFEDFGQRLDGHLGYGLGLGCPDCCGGRRYNVKIHLTENHIIWNAPSNATSTADVTFKVTAAAEAATGSASTPSSSTPTPPSPRPATRHPRPPRLPISSSRRPTPRPRT